jgi:hypothetical protein
MSDTAGWTRAVVRVGGGRGFVVESDRERFVITAGHCLPNLPPSMSGMHTYEQTYANLIGIIGEEPSLWAECVFVDPVSDLAVLGAPDNQEVYEEWLAYKDMIDAATPLSIGGLRLSRSSVVLSSGETETILRKPQADCSAWLLSLDGEWFRCSITGLGRSLWISGATADIVGGMSGSPILNDDGEAIGVVCVSSSADKDRGGGPNPFLARNLPGWLIEKTED